MKKITKKVWCFISVASIFLFSNLVYAIPPYDGPNSDEWTEIFKTLWKFFSNLF